MAAGVVETKGLQSKQNENIPILIEDNKESEHTNKVVQKVKSSDKDLSGGVTGT